MGILLDYEPCDDCQKFRKDGVTMMEVVNHPLTEGQPEIQNGIYPTGRWCVIEQNAAETMFSDYLTNKNALYADQELFDSIIRMAMES